MGPQGAMGLSVIVVFDGHVFLKFMRVLSVPWGCLLLWYLLVMSFKNL